MKAARPEEKDTRKVAIYARKSKVTESGKSVENQITKCKSYADLKFDAREADVLVYQDEGLSGYYSDRPQYMQLLRDIAENKIKAVICYKFDRISRRTLDLLNLVEQLKIKKIAFISCTDDVDTSSRTGKIVMSLLASIAEFERDIIAERIADNMYELAKEGRWLGGTTPLGFWSKKEHLNMGGKKTTVNHLEPVEAEQAVVKEMFRVFLKQRSLGKVVGWAEEHKLVTRLGKAHTRVSVKNILQNPVYAVADSDTYAYFKSFDVPIYAEQTNFNGLHGLMIYNKTEQIKEQRESSTAIHPEYVCRSSRREVSKWIIAIGAHKGIIPGREWILTQEILKENRSRCAQPNEQSQSLLSGLLVCPACGAVMYTRMQSGRFAPDHSPRYNYICKAKYLNRSACATKERNGNELDSLVLNAICSMSQPDCEYFHILQSTKNMPDAQSESRRQEQKRLQKRQIEIASELLSQVVTLRTAPETVKPAILTDMERLTAEQTECVQSLEQLFRQEQDTEAAQFNLQKTCELLRSFPALIRLATYGEKLVLLRRAVEKIVPTENSNGDKVLHIFFKGSSGEEEALPQ